MVVEKLTQKDGTTDLRTIASGSEELCLWVILQDFVGTMCEQYDFDFGSVYDLPDSHYLQHADDKIWAGCNKLGAVIRESVPGTGNIQWLLKNTELPQATLIDIRQEDGNSYLLAHEGTLTRDEALARLRTLMPGHQTAQDMFHFAATSDVHNAGFWILLPTEADDSDQADTHRAGYKFIEDFMFTDMIHLKISDI